MKSKYPAYILRSEETGTYTVVIPDLSIRVTGGATMEDALRMAQDAIHARAKGELEKETLDHET